MARLRVSRGGTSVLIVSLGTTLGWQTVESELAGSLARLGVAHRVARMRLGPESQLRRAGLWPVVDGLEALACRRALLACLREEAPRSVIFLSTTAALLAPIASLRARGIEAAIYVDCPAAVNRVGSHNAGQRALERRRFAEASLTIATGPRSAEVLSPLVARLAVVPVPVECGANGPGRAVSSGDAVVYAADPEKKGLDVICQAWWRLGQLTDGRALLVTGGAAERGRRFLLRRGIAEPPGLVWCGRMSRLGHLDIVRGAGVYVSASRLEEAGIAQLEALACGTPLVTTPSRGAYEAFPVARRLAPEFATPDRSAEALAHSLASAFALDRGARARYATASREALLGFSRGAVDQALAEDVLPILLR